MPDAIVIDIEDPTGSTLVEDLRAELARARRSLGDAYQQRQDARQHADALLELHGCLDTIETLTAELGLRGTA